MATKPGQKELNPAALDLDPYLDETLQLLGASPTPHEVLVDAVTYVRWAERDATYAELLEVARRGWRTCPDADPPVPAWWAILGLNQ